MRIFIFTVPIALILLSTLNANALINAKPLPASPDIVRIKFSNGWNCSGVYLDPFTILTAAHCITTNDNSIVLGTSYIESENEEKLDVKLTQLIPNDNYKEQFWPTHDVGVIKTTKNNKFKGEFQLQEFSNGILNKAILFGCGKSDSETNELSRKFGENTYIKIGNILLFLGENSNGARPLGTNVSVAPNDSGGPIIDKASGKIVGVISATTIKDSVYYKLPILSIGTSTLSKTNLKFIQNNMGLISFSN